MSEGLRGDIEQYINQPTDGANEAEKLDADSRAAREIIHNEWQQAGVQSETESLDVAEITSDKFQLVYLEDWLKSQKLDMSVQEVKQIVDSVDLETRKDRIALLQLGEFARTYARLPGYFFEDSVEEKTKEPSDTAGRIAYMHERLEREGNPDYWKSIAVSKPEYRQIASDLLKRFPFPEFEQIFPENYFNSDICIGKMGMDELSKQIENAANRWRTEAQKQFQSRLLERSPNLSNYPELANRIFSLLNITESIKGYFDGINEEIDKAEKEYDDKPEFKNPSETLSDEELRRQLALRESLIKKTADGKGFGLRIGWSLLGKEYDNIDTSKVFAEQEVAYGALLISPKISSQEFFDKIKTILGNLPNYFNKSRPSGLPNATLEKSFYTGLAEQFSARPFEGCKILEIGGNSALQAFTRMGGTSSAEVDAGYNSYSANYSAGPREKMITLENYQSYGLSHSADVICSSRLFDRESGIGDIAEPKYGESSDMLGEQEMTLIMCNLLKDNGFMVHYDERPPVEFSQDQGIKELYAVDPNTYGTGPSSHISRYHASERRSANEISIGYKRAKFNSETQTWELV